MKKTKTKSFNEQNFNFALAYRNELIELSKINEILPMNKNTNILEKIHNHKNNRNMDEDIILLRSHISSGNVNQNENKVLNEIIEKLKKKKKDSIFTKYIKENDTKIASETKNFLVKLKKNMTNTKIKNRMSLSNLNFQNFKAEEFKWKQIQQSNEFNPFHKRSLLSKFEKNEKINKINKNQNQNHNRKSLFVRFNNEKRLSQKRETIYKNLKAFENEHENPFSRNIDILSYDKIESNSNNNNNNNNVNENLNSSDKFSNFNFNESLLLKSNRKRGNESLSLNEVGHKKSKSSNFDFSRKIHLSSIFNKKHKIQQKNQNLTQKHFRNNSNSGTFSNFNSKNTTIHHNNSNPYYNTQFFIKPKSLYSTITVEEKEKIELEKIKNSKLFKNHQKKMKNDFYKTLRQEHDKIEELNSKINKILLETVNKLNYY